MDTRKEPEECSRTVGGIRNKVLKEERDDGIEDSNHELQFSFEITIQQKQALHL